MAVCSGFPALVESDRLLQCGTLDRKEDGEQSLISRSGEASLTIFGDGFWYRIARPLFLQRRADVVDVHS